MANEASVRVSLTINKGNLPWSSPQTGWQATLTGTKGPTPGAVTVATGAGTDVVLTELSTPGLCYLRNIDSANFVSYGIKDVASGVFYPLGELLPGEDCVLRLSRVLGKEYAGAGTATDPAANRLHFRADTAAVAVQIMAFEK